MREQGVDEPTARALAFALRKSAKDKPDWLADWLGDQEACDMAAVALGLADKSTLPAKRRKRRKNAPNSSEPKVDATAALRADNAWLQGERRRAKQRGGSKKSERQLAEDYRKRRNTAPTHAVDDSLNIALAAFKSASAANDVEDVAKGHYPTSFVSSAQKILPKFWFDQVHTHARASAGGKASGTVRRHASDPDAKLNDLWERRNALAQELEETDKAIEAIPCPDHPQGEEADVVKTGAPVGTVHVDVPLGSNKPKPVKPKVKLKDDEVVKETDETEIAKRSRLDQSVMLAEAAYNAEDDYDPQLDKLENAQRLVVGMDWEMRVGAYGPEDARARASRTLSKNLNFYDGKLQKNDTIRALTGLDIDIGSGQVREIGCIGIDLYPYDYGTAVHDVGTGLPFPDGSVRSARLVNALQYMPDFTDDATPLLMEIQRCLTYGGKLLYVGRGDLTEKADWSMLPGLVLVGHEDTTPLTPNQEPSNSDLNKQVFERIRVRVPRVFGADPEWLGDWEETASDIDYALFAMGVNMPAEENMADLLKSADSQDDAQLDVNMGAGAPVVGTNEYKKIVYAVVYAPHELDFDGEYMDAETIEEMAHGAIRDMVPIKSEHVSDPIGAHIVESYIAPVDFEITGQDGPQSIPKGAWVIAIQFTDDAEWQKVLTGEYRGISVGGAALLEHR